MAREIIYYNNAQLNRVNQVFSTIHPGWTQRVEAIFTENKSDTIWVQNGSAAGVTLSATVRPQTSFLNAIIAIDLSSFLTPIMSLSMMGSGFNSTGKSTLVTSKPSFNEVRSKLFTTLTHELLHVVQGWVWGDDWGRMYNEARQDAISRDIFGDMKRSAQGMQNYSGYKNRYELAAFKFGIDWVSHNRQSISAGNFDDLIPVSTINNLLSAMK